MKRIFLIICFWCFESTSCSFFLWLLDEGGQSWLVGQNAHLLVAALCEAQLFLPSKLFLLHFSDALHFGWCRVSELCEELSLLVAVNHVL